MVAMVAAMVMSGTVRAQTGGTNSTTTTSTSRTPDTFVDTAQSVRTDTFSTRLLGILDGSTTVYDQTFNAAFGDATVQAALASAQAALGAAGAPQSVSFSGPTLTSSASVPLGSSTSTVITNTTSTQTAKVELTLGPQTILIGDLGLCAGLDANGSPIGCSGGNPQPFNVLVGWDKVNINTNTATTIFRTITTTTTFLTSAVYTLFGTTQGGGGGGGGNGTVPEPSALALLTLMLAAMAWGMRRRLHS